MYWNQSEIGSAISFSRLIAFARIVLQNHNSPCTSQVLFA